MAVAGNYHAESGRLRFQIDLRQIVQHVDRNSADLDRFSLRQLTGPCPGVDISADSGDGREVRQFSKNLRCPNVSRVNNVFRAAQCLDHFRTKQAVGVGDDADQDGSSQFPALSVGSQFSVRAWRVDFISSFISAYEGAPSSATYVPRV
jgi:hypothetical protein